MRFTIYGLHLFSAALLVCAAGGEAFGEDDEIARALSKVRDVKKDMFQGGSSVLGVRPGPEDMAAQQMRARPIPTFEPKDRYSVKYDSERLTILAKGIDRRWNKLKKDKKGKSKESVESKTLGITGARMAADYLGRQDLLIVDILPGTPADGKLEVRDIVIGANGLLFSDSEDPRPEMGYALVASQTPRFKGVITLHVVREGKGLDVKLDLGDTTPYSKTWPYNCPKTKSIRAKALALVMEKGPGAEGMLSRHKKGGFWTPLFLMASGDPKAMALVKQYMRASTKPASEYPDEVESVSSWRTGYALINVAEYYLLTGDKTVIPRIKYLVRILEKNQFPSGGWSHGRPPGYGEINNAGLACFIGMILARECGVKGDQDRMAKSILFFGSFCGTNFPYGLGTPGGKSGRMDNGMHGMAAIAFHLLGEDEMAKRWARPLCYMWMGRERGHAEGLFSPAWGNIGADIAPKPEFQMFMDHMLWYLEICRTPEGGITFMRGSRFPYPGGMTPAVGLFLYLPEHRLRILGAPRKSAAAK
jgi:hypothetical protein